MKRITFALSSFLFVSFAYSASFDCARASSKMEKLICSDPQLSKSDEELAGIYVKALKDSLNPKSIKEEQRKWLANVSVNCDDVYCLKEAYRARTTQLAQGKSISAETENQAQRPIVSAALEDVLKDCERTKAGDVTIKACTRLIDSGNLRGHSLAMIFNMRGNAMYAKGDYNSALADHNRAIELAPNFAIAYLSRGIAKNARLDNDAMADFDRAIELDPKFADAYFWRGNLKFGGSDMNGAIVEFTHAIEIDPKKAPSYYWFWRGLARLNKGSLDSAVTDFTHTIEITPTYARAYYNRGLAKLRMKDYNGAIANYNFAIKHDPKSVAAYSDRCYAKMKKRDWNGAITDCTRAIEIDPTFADSYTSRGLAKKGKGDLKGANADFMLADDTRASLGSPKYIDEQ